MFHYLDKDLLRWSFSSCRKLFGHIHSLQKHQKVVFQMNQFFLKAYILFYIFNLIIFKLLFLSEWISRYLFYLEKLEDKSYLSSLLLYNCQSHNKFKAFKITSLLLKFMYKYLLLNYSFIFVIDYLLIEIFL